MAGRVCARERGKKFTVWTLQVWGGLRRGFPYPQMTPYRVADRSRAHKSQSRPSSIAMTRLTSYSATSLSLLLRSIDAGMGRAS